MRSRVTLLGAFVLLAVCACDSGNEPTRCTFTLSPPNASFQSGGGEGTVTITAADASCTWSASSNANWLSIQQGASGTGSGAVTYRVAENATLDPRSATVTIATQTHGVSQQGRPPVSCTYTLDPASASFDDDGGTGTFAVNAPDGCTWSASGNAGFIHIAAGATGSGSETVSYIVDENNGSSTRTGTIAVADQTFTVTQLHELPVCTYSVAPVELTPCMPAGTLSTQVTAPAGCTWTASTDVPWLTITRGASGSGSGQITFSFTSNYDPPRTGIVMVRWPTPTAGQHVRVNQAGCTYGVSQTSFSFGPASAAGSFDVLQQSDPTNCGGPLQNACVWSAVSDVPWITITTPMPRTGDERVNFTVAPNTTGASRTGTIRVNNRSLTVVQGI